MITRSSELAWHTTEELEDRLELLRSWDDF